MVQVSNSIQTEYSQAVAPKTDATKADYMNSIMDQTQGNENGVETTSNANQTSKLDELLNELCKKFKNLNLNTQELKESGILYRITGLTETQLKNINEVELKNVMLALETAIKDSIVDGKLDLEKAGKLGNDYFIALKTGWTIEGFKKSNKNNAESLSARMERFFGIENFSSLPQNKIEEYLERYFNEFFVDKLKNAKTPAEKEQIYKQQLQDFGKLLINTPDEEKAIFKQAITSLVASNRVKGLKAVLASFDTPAARTEWANNWTTEDTKRLATKEDVEGNLPSEEDVTESVAEVTKNKDAEHIRKEAEALQKEAIDFFTKNKEALERISLKEIRKEALTDEEKKLVLLRDRYFKAAKAGEIVGTALNCVVGDKIKAMILLEMNKNAFNLPNYEDILKEVDEYVKAKTKEKSLTISDVELKKILNQATNGNYTRVITPGNTEPMAPPETVEKPVSDPSRLVIQQHTQEAYQDALRKMQEKQQQIAQNSNDKLQKFTVEKTSREEQEPKEEVVTNYKNLNMQTVTAEYLNNIIAKGGNKSKLFEHCCKVYSDASDSVQRFVETEFKTFGNYKEYLLNKMALGGSSLISFLNKTNTDISSIDLKHINTDFNTKRELERQEKKEEEKQA